MLLASKQLLALAKSVALTLAFLATLTAGQGFAAQDPGIPDTGAVPTVAVATSGRARPAADMPELRSTTSLNWAGYVADRGGVYTSVDGTWIVPTVSAADDGADATWIGIGGVHAHDLIQAGTETLVQDGALEYRAWYELLPGDSYLLPINVHPGDTIHASIAKMQEGDLWRISVNNVTTGERAVRDVVYGSSFSSAEWIEEMPAAVGSALSLDDFGAVRFLSGSATENGTTMPIASLGLRAIRMANVDGESVAVASDIGSAGQFTVVRTEAPATPVTIVDDAPTSYDAWAD